ncbi:MAG: ABC transporter substrate-binding protein [Candidatus Margulisbacteria bacterium]|nr:ABC transporter substrate-binding protein [Candidatus Margulisiibacteriota bacterium]
MRALVGLFVIWNLMLGIYSFALAKEYDGVWLLGFDLKRPVVREIKVRRAMIEGLDRKFIAQVIMSEEAVPIGYVPPGMLGYDPDLKLIPYDLKQAKADLKSVGYSANDKRLKNLKLLHTDGVKTIAIANKIKTDLQKLGIKLTLSSVDAFDEDQWAEELSSGKFDLFLLGYKADLEQLFSDNPEIENPDGYDLLAPLFKTGAEVNFFHYSSKPVDELFAKTAGFNRALSSERNTRLKKINRLIYNHLPAVGLFYIEKL